MTHDVIVLGAGAAGLFAAIHAGRRGRSVLVLEHAEKIGKKILISGGGRCNFTNRVVSAQNFISQNPHFAKSALARFTPQEFVEQWIGKHGIRFHEKTLGQLFCDASSRQIVDMLAEECRAAGVQIRTGCKIHSVDFGFRVETEQGTFHSASVIVATGGLSIPKMGATGFGYAVARHFGLDIVAPEPALVPVLHGAAEKEAWLPLSGVAFNARVDRFEEAVLFTHHGLSGPAILQASSYWQGDKPLHIDCAPHLNIAQTLIAAKKQASREIVRNALSRCIPKRFADRALDVYAPALAERPLTDVKDSDLTALGERLNHWTYAPAGTAGFEKAEVTRGGVSTLSLSSKTLEASAVKGLFFVGEVVDVTGWLGGYNFQWAWASGFSAGQVA